jgi:hypothetical protein
MPVANQKVAQQQAAARDIQLQQAVAAAPASTNTTQAAQQTGAALAQEAGQQQVQNTQQAAAGQNAVAQLGQQVQQIENQKALANQKMAAGQEQMDAEQKFAQISEQAKQEMYDSRRQFETDQLGQKFSNERQLADYARMRTQTEDQWQDYQQKTDQLSKRKIQVLSVANQKLMVAAEQQNAEIEQIKDQMTGTDINSREHAAQQAILEKKLDQQVRLKGQMAALQKSIAQQQADAANRAARDNALLSIGTVAAETAVIAAV